MWVTKQLQFQSQQNIGKDMVLGQYRLTEDFVTFHGSPTCLSVADRLQRKQQTKIRRTAGLIDGHVGHLEVMKATDRVERSLARR